MNDRTPTPNEAATVRRLAGSVESTTTGSDGMPRMWVSVILSHDVASAQHDVNTFLGKLHAAGGVVSTVASSLSVDETSNWTQVVVTYWNVEEVA